MLKVFLNKTMRMIDDNFVFYVIWQDLKLATLVPKTFGKFALSEHSNGLYVALRPGLQYFSKQETVLKSSILSS